MKTRNYTRREFSGLALGAIAATLPNRSARAASPASGVRLGVQTYSFRETARPGDPRAVDLIVESMTACGLGECELFSPQVEPPVPFGREVMGTPEWTKAREDVRRFRLTTPLEHFQAIARKFSAAGIRVYAYNLSFNDSFTDEEIDRGFAIARALGAEVITASATLPVARRVAPFADRHRMVVAMHNHSRVEDPNEFATPESFAAALKMSPYFRVNLDIGHFTAANYDALAYLGEHEKEITNLHLKDRKKNQGDNTPWGQGDTPIREVLRFLKERGSAIPAYVEYEYKGAGSPVDEVKSCLQYARAALA
jgi:sugar phosphate isomerase/epimerase